MLTLLGGVALAAGASQSLVDYPARAEECIAANSGAGSIDCLQSLFYVTTGRIAGLENGIAKKLASKRHRDEITPTHHQYALAALRDAGRKFSRFAARQCEFSVGASGAVASGSGQVYWSCRIRLNAQRIVDLSQILQQTGSTQR
ncbi:lysozyme inhibitor LprI family protein [Chitinimonas sp.]|uniref:lysozyme inhibitor LprI family protein n=1 Tax=Chitinimonas sp. TaxID=1934313 RepID=UPI0035B07DB2